MTMANDLKTASAASRLATNQEIPCTLKPL